MVEWREVSLLNVFNKLCTAFMERQLFVTHQYDNDKKMTIVNRYSRSVNMNSFAPFSLVGESATLPAYKDSRLLIHDDACAVTDSRPGLPPPSLARRLPPGHVRCRILTVKMSISTNIPELGTHTKLFHRYS